MKAFSALAQMATELTWSLRMIHVGIGLANDGDVARVARGTQYAYMGNDDDMSESMGVRVLQTVPNSVA